jgi:type II secretory pathway pseudopilin PulG
VVLWGKRTGCRPRPSRCDEVGFTLVEVIVAGLIMVMVLVPSALLLSSSTKILTVTQSKIVAANLAAGALDEDRALADATAWSVPASPAGSPIAPVGLPGTTTSTVNGVAFTIEPTYGWCTLKPALFWDAYGPTVPSTPLAYGIIVKVSWYGGHKLSAGAVLSTPGAVVLAGAGNTGGAPSSGTCPLAGTS